MKNKEVQPQKTSSRIFSFKSIKGLLSMTKIRSFASLLFVLNAGAVFAQAQTVPITTVIKSPLGESSANILRGTTVNLSSQSGSKANLGFGTNTSFGASLSSQFSPGMTVTASSNFNPSTAEIHSDIGSTPGSLGRTSAVISNLSAAGTGQTTIGGAPINASDAKFASGNATLEGLSAGINIVLDPTRSGFNVEAMPNVIGAACSIGDSKACKYTLDSGDIKTPLLDKNGDLVKDSKGDIVYQTDSLGKKPYSDQQFSSGSATATVNSNTTVDIGNTQFSSVFGQSF